jgi:uncharacterized protein DUF2252
MPAARAEAGRALRKTVPRSSHASWDPAGRPSPLRLLEESSRHRVPELVPIRAARMRASPFAFLRGAPAVMAHDLATTPVTGITVQVCGDAHLLNFGLFATPERNLSFGLNDFDETLPAPWEWDVKRLATSFVVAGRTVGFDPAVCRRAALAVVRTYREQLARYAGMRLLEVWYSRVDAAAIVALSRGRRRRAVTQRLDRAQHHTNLDALPRLTDPAGGDRRFVEEPPLLTHVAECDEAWMAEVLARYRAHDAARKVVGVGSGCSRRPATSSSAGRRRHQPLLRPPAVGHEGRSGSRSPRPGRPRAVRGTVRVGAGQGPRPQRGRRRHQRLPRLRGPLRPGGGDLRRGLRRPDRGRPRRLQPLAGRFPLPGCG